MFLLRRLKQYKITTDVGPFFCLAVLGNTTVLGTGSLLCFIDNIRNAVVSKAIFVHDSVPALI